MGGSSAINGMVYIRGNKEDYDEWSDLGNVGWDYNNVLRYFKKAEGNSDMKVINVLVLKFRIGTFTMCKHLFRLF